MFEEGEGDELAQYMEKANAGATPHPGSKRVSFSDEGDSLATDASSCEQPQQSGSPRKPPRRGSSGTFAFLKMPAAATQQEKMTKLKENSIPCDLAYIQSRSRALPTVTMGSRMQARMHALVESTVFDLCFTALIVLNAVCMGLEADLAVKKAQTELSLQIFEISETIFCFIFAMELVCRIYAGRMRYYTDPGWKWAVFDTFLVTLQIVEEVMKLLAIKADSTSASSSQGSMSYMRVLRMVRMVRILRMFRILQFVNELRVIATSILNSTKSLFWTIVLLIIIIYALAVYFTQISVGATGDESPEDGLSHYFGGVVTAMLTLYQAMTGGLDWDVVVTPLVDELSAVQGIIFSIYIAFMVLALTNVVTGVFVESALKSARGEDTEMAEIALRHLFADAGAVDEQKIESEKFQDIFSSPRMQALLERIGVDKEEAMFLVSLLDMNGKGEINHQEFIGGCLRIRSPAKAIDTLLVLHDLRAFVEEFRSFRSEVESRLER